MKLTHLEFSFYLTTCNLSSRTQTVTNPFTGQPHIFFVDDGLTADECSALRAAMSAAGFEKSEIPGEGYVYRMFPDNSLRLLGEIDVGRTGFAVELVIRRLTNEPLDLLLAIARAGNFAFTDVTGNHVHLLAPSATKLVAERWPGAPLVRSSEDLRIWLEKVIGARAVRRWPG